MIRGFRAISALALCCLIVIATDAGAAITEDDIVDPGEINQDYRDAIRGRGLQADIVYLRPETDFRPEETERLVVIPEPEEEREREVSVTTSRWVWGLTFGALLLGLIALFVIYGGNIAVSFSSQPTDGRRDEDEETLEIDPERAALMAQPLDSFLESLRRMADRREALILLVSRALERAATLNDLRLGRSQTARDVLRILPRSWSHIGNMRRLVREVEIVHFGGRDLPEEIWEECLDAARPIFGERGRA